MLVSIVMPAYNAGLFIENAIGSIIAQEYQNWELLIADDGSTDNTRQIVDRYLDPRIKSFHNESNLGYLKACNKVLALCRGQFITFQDADDWSAPDRLSKQLAAFENNSELGIVGTWARYQTLQGAILREKKTPVSHEEIYQHMWQRNPFCGASIMVRKEVYDAIGGYKEYFDRIGNEDYDWAMRIVERFKAANLPEFLYFVQVTANSISRNIRSPRQLISHDLVHFLAEQRKFQNSDSLSGLDTSNLIEFEQRILQLYIKDKALIYRKAADIAAYNREWKKVRYNAWKAWKAKPNSIINCKYLVSSLLGFRS
jgi:glycosyltransferase involved in cell wall biosynthesis